MIKQRILKSAEDMGAVRSAHSTLSQKSSRKQSTSESWK